MPKANRKFWKQKLSGNASRDKKHIRALKRLGWKVVVLWECQLDERRLRLAAARIRGGT
jgi:DNA mismatch endonuclease (patch repair protein)